MKQCFRIAIKRTGIETAHYVIRDDADLKNMLNMITELLAQRDDIEQIKWVPIMSYAEVNHAKN